MESLPVYISLLFAATTLLTAFIFIKAAHNSGIVFIILISWLVLQAFISRTGFYLSTDSFPPRFVFLAGPAVLFIVILFITKKGRKFIDQLDPKLLTLLHIIRIPVEIVLFLLFLNKTVPQLMTFEGRNFDILAGISAPMIFYFGYKKRILGKNILLAWNFICLALLLNIVIIAVLSVPFPFQQFGFDQPDIAVLYFPFIWLPGCVVPLVLLSHLACIRRLIYSATP